MSCIFCNIVKGDIPSRKLYKDEDFIVILDAFPSCAGHSLVIPKAHAADVFAMDGALAARAFALAAKIAARIKDALGCDGVNILQNNGAAAGQSVGHFHVHVIPRYEDDGLAFAWEVRKPSDEAMDQVRKRLEITTL